MVRNKIFLFDGLLAGLLLLVLQSAASAFVIASFQAFAHFMCSSTNLRNDGAHIRND